MAKGEYVYFSSDGNWWKTSDEADQRDAVCELRDHINNCFSSMTPLHCESIAEVVLKRYNLSQRYDYATAQPVEGE